MPFINYNPSLEGENFIQAFGISQERFNEFTSIIDKVIVNLIDMVINAGPGSATQATSEELMVELAMEANNPEEAFLAGLMYERGVRTLEDVATRMPVYTSMRLSLQKMKESEKKEYEDRLRETLDSVELTEPVRQALKKLILSK